MGNREDYVIPAAVPATLLNLIDQYEPSAEVLRMHNIPRLSAALHESSYTGWAIDNQSINHKSVSDILSSNILYFQSLYTLPLLIFCIGTIAIFAWIVSRYMVARCGPKDADYLENVDKVVFRRKIVVFFFGFSIISSIICNNYLWKSDADIKSASQLIVSSAKNIRTLCTNTVANFADINDNALNVLSIIENSQCDMSDSAMTQSKNNVIAGANTILTGSGVPYNYLQEIPMGLDSFESVFDLIYQNDYVYAVYSFFFILTALFVIGYFYRSKIIMVSSNLITCIVVIGCLALSCGFMVWVEGLADFCMTPVANLVAMAPSQSTKQFLEFVGTCATDDPMAPSINDFKSGYQTAYQSLEYLASTCTAQIPAEQAKWSDAVASLSDVSNGTTYIEEVNNCETMNVIFNLVVNETMCSQGFYGVYELFLNMFALTTIYFILIIVVGMLWEFFKFGWNLSYGDYGIDINDPESAYLDSNDAELRMTAFRQGRGNQHKLSAADNGPITSNADARGISIINPINDQIPGPNVPDRKSTTQAKAGYAANSSLWGFGRASASAKKANSNEAQEEL